MWRVTFSFFSPSLALSISVRSRAKAQTCSHKTSWIFELRSNESISSLEKKHTFSYSLLPIETRSSSTVNTILWRFVLTESNQIKNFSFHSFFWSFFCFWVEISSHISVERYIHICHIIFRESFGICLIWCYQSLSTSISVLHCRFWWKKLWMWCVLYYFTMTMTLKVLVLYVNVNDTNTHQHTEKW